MRTVYAFSMILFAACSGREDDEQGRNASSAAVVDGGDAEAGPTKNTVDTSRLGAPCENSDACRDVGPCAYFVDVEPAVEGARCVMAFHPCDVVTCAQGKVCRSAASDPEQTHCGDPF